MSGRLPGARPSPSAVQLVEMGDVGIDELSTFEAQMEALTRLGVRQRGPTGPGNDQVIGGTGDTHYTPFAETDWRPGGTQMTQIGILGEAAAGLRQELADVQGLTVRTEADANIGGDGAVVTDLTAAEQAGTQ